MPPSVQRFGDVYVAASVEGDWFGDDVVAYTSPAPQGPWTEAMRYTPETRCGDDCNNYGAFVLPDLEGDRVVIALSNNAKDMRRAFADASLYRVGVRAVDVPGISASNMSRSPDLELARAEPAVPEPAVTVPVPDATTFVGGRGQQTGRWVIPPSASVAVPALTDAGGTDPGVLTSVVAALLVFGTAAVLPVAGLTFVRSTRRTRFRRGHVLDRLHGAAPGRTHHPPGRRAPDPTPPTPSPEGFVRLRPADERF